MAKLVHLIRHKNPPPPKTRVRLPLHVIRTAEELYARLPAIECQGKCQECCCPVGDMMTEFERDRIIARTGKVPNRFPQRVVDGTRVLDAARLHEQKCNLLSADEKCTVHDIRPAICRLWGTTPLMKCPHGCKGAGETPTEVCDALFVESVVTLSREYPE